MRSEGRRRLLATVAGTVVLSGCFETPPTSEEQDAADGDGGGNGPDGGNGSTGGTASDGSDGDGAETDDGDGATDDGASGTGGSFDADVRFKTERVHSEINTFDVSVRVDLKDSDRVRIQIGQVERTYNRSGIYDDVTRARLDTNLVARAYTDGEWNVVERGKVPIENDDDFAFPSG